MNKRVGGALLAVAVLVVVAAVGYGVLRGTDSLFPASDECTVEVDGHRAELTVEQAENAALITADIGTPRAARPGRLDRAGDGVPGVRPDQPRVR